MSLEQREHKVVEMLEHLRNLAAEYNLKCTSELDGVLARAREICPSKELTQTHGKN